MVVMKSRRRRRKLPPLRMRLCGCQSAFTIAPSKIHQVVYRTEQQRGYAYQGELWSPGFFRADLTEQNTATFIGSTEAWDIIDVLSPEDVLAAERERRARLLQDAIPKARQDFPAELVFAADQFVITPAGRAEEAARAHAAGDEVRTVIAGYHWFTDWGRDTMISLEGLTLITGRCLEAGYILRTFAHYVRDGLIPNMFPDGAKEGQYHTADATLWFFHALNRYLERTKDRNTLGSLLPVLIDIAEHHLRGTKFNIHVDPNDGLLVQGERVTSSLGWMQRWAIGSLRRAGEKPSKLTRFGTMRFVCLRVGCAKLATMPPRNATRNTRNARAYFVQRTVLVRRGWLSLRCCRC